MLNFCSGINAQQALSKAQAEQVKKQLQSMLDSKQFDRATLEKMKKEMGQKQLTSIPDKSVLLSSLPHQPFTKEQLVAYLKNLEASIAKTTPGIAQEAGSLLAGTTAEQGEAKAVMAWYNSAPETAIYMSTHLGIQHPDGLLNLNNLSAMLNLYGSQEKAIPILKTVLQYVPQNTMVLNNLGQAYAGLGARDTALYYLSACMAVAPHHPEACTTAGKIEESKGNTEKAVEDYRNALKGAYSEEAANRLEKLSPNEDVLPFILPRFNPPYFNLYKYALPEQNMDVDSTESFMYQYSNYRSLLGKLSSAYSQLGSEEAEKARKDMVKTQQQVLHGEELFIANPFTNLAGRMLVWSMIATHNEADYVHMKKQQLEGDLDTLYRNYQRKDQATDGGCKEHNHVANKYLEEAALVRKDWQKYQLRAARNVFYLFTYWQYLGAFDNYAAHASYYENASKYLTEINQLCQTQFVYPYPYCQRPNVAKPAPQEDSTQKAPDCPINIEIPIIIGKIKLDCSQFVISGGEALRLKYKKNFTTGQSTMSVGAGLGFDVGKNFDGVNIKGSIKAEENFYVCFDGGNNFQDAGFSFEANASGSIDMKIDGVPKSMNLASGEVGDGYKIGINSGWSDNGFKHSGKTILVGKGR